MHADQPILSSKEDKSGASNSHTELILCLGTKKASLNGWLFLPYVLLWVFVANNTSSF